MQYINHINVVTTSMAAVYASRDQYKSQVACFLSSPEEAFQTIPVPCICKAPPGRGNIKQFGEGYWPEN